MKSTTILFFEATFDISAYLAAPVGEAREDLAMDFKGNYWQFRNIEHRGGDVFGRLCKIKTLQHVKPTLGRVTQDRENRPSEDVIESACFRFRKRGKVLICEQKGEVAPMPNGAFLRLLRFIHSDGLNGDDEINIMVKRGILEHLRQRKHLIKKARILLSPKTAIKMYSENEDLLDVGYGIEGGICRELAVDIKCDQGQVSDNWLMKIIRMFRSGKIMGNSRFDIDGETSVRLSEEFVRSEKMSFEFDETQDEDTNRSNLYDALRRVTI